MISFRQFLEAREIGLIEKMFIKDVGELPAKIDSGNGAYNVLHGINVENTGDNEISFETVDGKRITKELVDDIVIHVGAGEEEHRPVVHFDIKLGNDVYRNVPFSIGDRSQNEYPILVGKDFISDIGALINVDKEYTL